MEGDTLGFKMPSLYGGMLLDVAGKLEGEDLRLRLSSPRGDKDMIANRINQ